MDEHKVDLDNMAKILIIDDRPVNRQFLITLLGYQKHELREASDGAEGLRIGREFRPDLIISDVLMPTMDGYEFVRRLREEPEIGKTPVVFSTAHYLSRESQALAEKCGITSIIYKPCEPQVVLDIVADTLAGVVAAPPSPLPVAEFDRDHQQLLTNKLAEKTEQLRDAHGKLTALIELSTELAQERDPVELLDRYCSVARDVIGARWTLVVFLDVNRTAVQHVGAIGLELEASAELRSALLATGVFKTVITEGRTICLSDVTSTPAELQLPKPLPRATSLLVAPLAMRGQIYGWICLADKLGLDAFSEQDQHLAGAMAAKMAVAYNNALLYSDSVVYANRLEAEMSKRNKVEQELSENRARLAGIIDSAMDAIITVDSDQLIVMFNEAAVTMFRCASAEAIGQPLDRFIPTHFRGHHANAIHEFGKTGVSSRTMGATRAVSGLRADGEEFPLEASISQIEVAGKKLYTVIMRDISERKASEAALRESEARFRKMFEEGPMGVAMASLTDGRVLQVNQALCGMLGYTVEELTRLTWEDITHPDDRAVYKETLRRLREGQIQIHSTEKRYLKKSGETVWGTRALTKISSADGKSFYALAMIEDITVRKLAEEKLRESELRYHSLFSNMLEGFAYCRMLFENGEPQDYIYLEVNSAFEKLTGLQNVVGKKVSEVIPGIRMSREILAPFGRVARGGKPEGFERWQAELGMWFQVAAYGAGKDHFVIVFDNITERKHTEKNLRESEEQLRLFNEATNDMFWTWDLLTGEVSRSTGFERVFGYGEQEIIPVISWWEDRLHPEDRDRVLTAFQTAVERGDPTCSYEYQFRRLNGTYAAISDRAYLVRDVSGKVVRALGAMTDITERKQANEALKETNQHLNQTLAELRDKTNELSTMTQQLWQSSKLATMGELAASVAHELNNPLTTVTLTLDLIMMQLQGDPEKLAALEKVRGEAERMGNLVSNLLQFSRRSHAQLSTVDLREEIRNTVDFIYYYLRDHRIKVEFDFAADLAPVHADRQQMRQLFLNLLTNSTDAMPEGGTLMARARMATPDNGAPHVIVEFEDTGSGISAEDLQNVWEPFFSTKSEGQGTGLGLAICKRIVEEHLGTMTIESELGRGTTVRMMLPVSSGWKE